MSTPKLRDTRNKGVTREMVATSALAVLQESGIDRLSMRAVALRLGVSPTALYNHVRDKAELLSLVADALRAQVVVDDSLPPRAQLHSLLRQLRDLGSQHPMLLEATSLETSAHAAELAVLELRLLAQIGLTPAQVRIAYQGLVMLVSGAAVVWRVPEHATRSLRDLAEVAVDADDRQLLRDLEALPSQGKDEIFAVAVDNVLDAAALRR